MIARTLALLLSMLAASAAQAAQARSTPASQLPFVLSEIGPGVYAAIDGSEHKAGSNAGFVIGDDCVLVVDAFFNLDAARSLVAEIRRLTTKPIRYLVNTHYHVDHTGGDQALRDAGALIIAHRNVRSWIRPENVHLLGDRITPELKARIDRLPLPDLVTDTHLTIWLGSRKVVVEEVPGHTGGDLAIIVPDAGVVFTGDLLWRKIAPNLIDGSVKEWLATDERLATMPRAAQIHYVPGHGSVAGLSDLENFRAYLIDLQRLVGVGRRSGLEGSSLVGSVMPRLKALYPDWAISDRSATAEIFYMDQELSGTKRRPVPAAQ